MNRPDDLNEPGGWDTTFHVRRAASGDADSLGSVVARLSPLLMAAAEYRLGTTLRAQIDPEDLVNDAWIVAFPKLSTMEERDGRITPVLLKYLMTTINYRINNLMRRRIKSPIKATPDPDLLAEVPADASGAITRAVRHEAQGAVRACLDELQPKDREVILLRGIEQNSSKTVAVVLGLSVDAVDKRFSRALQRLRERLPESVFAELDSEL